MRTPEYNTQSRFIASLSPIDLAPVGRPFGFPQHKRPVLDRAGHPTGKFSYGGYITYAIKGVGYDKSAKPFVLEVQDGFQHSVDPASREPNESPQFVTAESIIADLLAHWQVGLHGSGGLGLPVWEVKTEDGVPTEEEIEEHRQSFTEYCRWLYNEGNRLSSTNKHGEIHPQHRMAGIFLGKMDDWLRAYRADDLANCPLCGSPVAKSVYICKECGCVVREIPAEMLALNPQLVGKTKAR